MKEAEGEDLKRREDSGMISEKEKNERTKPKENSKKGKAEFSLANPGDIWSPGCQ